MGDAHPAETINDHQPEEIAQIQVIATCACGSGIPVQNVSIKAERK